VTGNGASVGGFGGEAVVGDPGTGRGGTLVIVGSRFTGFVAGFQSSSKIVFPIAGMPGAIARNNAKDRLNAPWTKRKTAPIFAPSIDARALNFAPSRFSQRATNRFSETDNQSLLDEVTRKFLKLRITADWSSEPAY
jgi:hypothetical protein